MSSSVKCNGHDRPVLIFCTVCDVAICDKCLTSKEHRGHPRSSLKDACEKQMADLAKSTKDLEGKMRKLGSVPALEPILTGLENNFTKSKDKINKLYKDLDVIVEENKKKALQLLDAMEKQLSDKLLDVEEKAEEIQQGMADISNDLQELENETDQNTADTLKQYKELEER
ncbi:RING finger domain and kelch repeat-containing protein DDB_G0271372-like [Engraulis encrasicolus]|uniref:RING finger domain and kelch repeat-containing protein DDB_G0271372-like n=1 Tax=Engraulis encrasicolus TaxID=184585 RepID=UPI002FD13E68